VHVHVHVHVVRAWGGRASRKIKIFFCHLLAIYFLNL
jgi:hypothetical protein